MKLQVHSLDTHLLIHSIYQVVVALICMADQLRRTEFAPIACRFDGSIDMRQHLKIEIRSRMDFAMCDRCGCVDDQVNIKKI